MRYETPQRRAGGAAGASGGSISDRVKQEAGG